MHWFLVNNRPLWRRTILLLNCAYLLVYGIFRIGAVYWVLAVFGAQTGKSAGEAFMDLRTTCRLGTATIGIANSRWFILSLRKFGRRYLGQDVSKNV